MRTKYGSPMVIWMGNRLVLYVDHPDQVKSCLSSEKCLDKGYSYRFLREHFKADGLITLPGIFLFCNSKHI